MYLLNRKFAGIPERTKKIFFVKGNPVDRRGETVVRVETVY
jgi:hypothetical protein